MHVSLSENYRFQALLFAFPPFVPLTFFIALKAVTVMPSTIAARAARPSSMAATIGKIALMEKVI